jgi:hypothetical protein
LTQSGGERGVRGGIARNEKNGRIAADVREIDGAIILRKFVAGGFELDVVTVEAGLIEGLRE